MRGAELSCDRALYWSCCQKCPGRSPPRERVTPSQPGFLRAGLTRFFLAWAGCSWAWRSICMGWRAPDGGLPGKCLPGARLVPESMSHEQSNPIKPLSPARPGAFQALPQRDTASCPQSQDRPPVSLPGPRGCVPLADGEPSLRTSPASQHLSALPGQCPGFPCGNSPVPPPSPLTDTLQRHHRAPVPVIQHPSWCRRERAKLWMD